MQRSYAISILQINICTSFNKSLHYCKIAINCSSMMQRSSAIAIILQINICAGINKSLDYFKSVIIFKSAILCNDVMQRSFAFGILQINICTSFNQSLHYFKSATTATKRS